MVCLIWQVLLELKRAQQPRQRHMKPCGRTDDGSGGVPETWLSAQRKRVRVVGVEGHARADKGVPRTDCTGKCLVMPLPNGMVTGACIT